MVNRTLDLIEHLHPSLELVAFDLEQSIIRLQLGTDLLIARHGKDVLQRHAEVARLAEAAILNYALFCGAARASRAYCIGLRYAENDMLTANCLSHECSERVVNMMTAIENGSLNSNDANYGKIADQLFGSKGYFFVHPLSKNF